MWERFSTSGLAGSYLDELTEAGIEARMEFLPRRALDPFPFLVGPVEEDDQADIPAGPRPVAEVTVLRLWQG
jgi:hypothetical protein